MSTLLRARPITADEFEKFDPEWRYDLIRGELIPMPPMPGEEHGAIANLFTVYVGIHVIQQRLGGCFAAETRFVIEQNPDTAIAPDWAFIARERLPKKRSPRFSRIVPDAVLEVRSPGDNRREVLEKVQRWLAAGVRIVWELDPDTQVMIVYRPGQEPRTLGIEDAIDGEEVLPGFSLPMRRLFAEEEEED
jgi:Uma2 family endonuclease